MATKAMRVKQLIEELGKFNPEAEALIVLTPTERELEESNHSVDVSWHAIALVEDGGWENEDKSSPIIGIHCGELIIG